MSYLHFNNNKNMPARHYTLQAGTLQFKQFTKLNSESKRAWFEINAFAFQYLFYLWVKTAGSPPKMPPPMFDAVLDGVIVMVNNVLSSQSIKNCADLVRALEARVLAIKPSSQPV